MSDLNNIFSSSNCLTEAQLINYIQQKLDRDETYLVESHLNDCPFCSDAIDGLMEADLIEMQTIIKEIKPQLIHQQIKNLPTEKIIDTPTPLKISSNKNKWLVAASVLLLMGLGGFSVYSFMHNQSHDLAKNEDAKSLPTSTTYTETSTPTNTEIVQLNVPNEEIKTDKKEIDSKKAEPFKEAIAKKEIEFVPSTKKIVEPKSTTKETKIEQEPLLETQTYHDNYSQKETKALDESVAEKDVAIKQKTSSVGMSNKKNIAQSTPSSANQLNYSSDNNFNKNIDNSYQISNYENGILSYNKGDYKNAIKFLELDLINSTLSNKEDIEYYLAMSYLKNGNNNKAQKLFEKLMASEKYKPIILEQLYNTKK